MNSRERVRRAMRHELPDRVPVLCQLALGHYFLHCATPPAEIWFDSDVLIDTLRGFQQRYRFDGFLFNVPGRPPDWRSYLAGRQPTEQGERLIWPNGLVTLCVPDDNAQTSCADGSPLPRADAATVDPADPTLFRTPGYVWNTWHAPHLFDIAPDANLADPAAYPAWFTRGVRQARELAPEVSIHAEVFSPFTHLMELFGYEQALVALLDTPATCHRLLEIFAGVVQAQVRCYAPCDPDAILISSAFAGAGFIGRDMYREFVLPYERSVVDVVHAARLPVYTHTCGAIGDRLDLMAGTGLDGIDTLDPPPLGTVDLAQAKRDFGERLFFKGNLDAVNEMLRADDAAFDRAVRQRLEIGRPGSGYILSSACSVAPRVRPERLVRMVELTEEHGRY